MIKTIPTILLASIMILGCSPKEDVSPVELNQKFGTRVGQYHMTPDMGFIFGISDIVEDTRGSCPKRQKVNCIWDGAITVRLKLTDNSGKSGTEYREVMAHQRQNFGKYLLEIHDVRPRTPNNNHNKYRFMFELTRRNTDD